MSENERRCEELYRYKERLVRYVVSIGRLEQDAQDIVQIVIARTCAKIETVPSESVWAYLRVAARNEAFNQATRTRTDDPLDEINQPLADRSRSPEDELIAREERARFQQTFNETMAEFSPETQQILFMRRRGMSNDQIAEDLGLHPTAVRSRFSRAKKQLCDDVGDPPTGLSLSELLGDDDDA